MIKLLQTMRAHFWRVTTTACANASNQSVTDALIYTSAAEAQEAMRRIEKRIDGMDRWFIRKEETPKMDNDNPSLMETILGYPIYYPIYWFVCWTENRKAAKKWPWNEPRLSPPPSINMGLLLWAMLATAMAVDAAPFVAVGYHWISVVMLTILGIGFGIMAWGRTSKVREANAKLAAIKQMVSESSPTYRTGEPASHASIRKIIG